MTSSVASEWTKLWSVRSTWWSLAGGAALMLLLCLAYGLDSAYPPEGATAAQAGTAVQDAAALGMLLAQFALLALATLTVTGEYASGSMLATLQWEPRRVRVLLAKVAVVAPVVLVVSAALMLVGSWVTDLSAGDHGVFVLTDVLEISLRTGLYVALAAVLSMGLGFVLRSTAGTLTLVFLMLMLLPLLLGSLTLDVVATIADYLPGSGGLHFASSAQMVGLGEVPYSPGVGLLVLLVWTGAALAAGSWVLRRRDV